MRVLTKWIHFLTLNLKTGLNQKRGINPKRVHPPITMQRRAITRWRHALSTVNVQKRRGRCTNGCYIYEKNGIFPKIFRIFPKPRLKTLTIPVRVTQERCLMSSLESMKKDCLASSTLSSTSLKGTLTKIHSRKHEAREKLLADSSEDTEGDCNTCR